MPQEARALRVPDLPRSTFWSRLWEPFWVLPMVVVVLAFSAGLALPQLDEALAEHVPYVFQGGPDGARSLLGTIASAMISVTGLVFSITMVVLQLASSQFTPRILGTFLQSRITQLTLGLFIASFVFALTVLRSVQGGSEAATEFVPQVSVTLAFLLVTASVGLFIAFIQHITTSIQVTHVTASLGDRTRALACKVFDADADADAPLVPAKSCAK